MEVIYRRYTDHSWGSGDKEFCGSLGAINMEVTETAVILSTLKKRGGIKALSDVEDVLRELGDGVPDGYLAELRKVWEKVNKN